MNNEDDQDIVTFNTVQHEINTPHSINVMGLGNFTAMDQQA